ncbi:MAG TPA: threonine/serine exporter family protein [Gemmatimonadales bacterium]|nr:threonine/serine exporter family protein [Gemmatimonadales bacterium]
MTPDLPPRPTRTSWTGWTPANGHLLPQAFTSADPRIAFILNRGRSLHTSGYSADRLEEALSLTSDRLGLDAQLFSTPTSIMASFGPQDDQRTFMIRVSPSDSNLGKLARVDQITRDVIGGRLTPAEGNDAIHAVESAPPDYGPVVTTLAFGIASGSAARFLGGGASEMLAGLLIGWVIGLLAILAEHHPPLGRIFEPVAAFTASVVVTLAAAFGAPVSVLLATLSGVIILIPGLTLTTAFTELSTRHLASGTARLAGALVLLLGITFGIALGGKLVTMVTGPVTSIDPVPLPGWTLGVSLIVSPLAFLVLLKAEWKDARWILAAGAMAFLGARVGGQFLGPELGAFGGALLTGVGSRLYSRFTNRPSQITLVPGLLLLVPGSLGLRSFTSLMDGQAITGVEGIFRVGIIAVSLASGILIARLITPGRALME